MPRIMAVNSNTCVSKIFASFSQKKKLPCQLREESATKELSEHMEEEETEAKQTEASFNEGSSSAEQGAQPSEEAGNLTAEKGQSPKETSRCFLFKCLMNVKKEGNDVLVEMHWVEGQNRDLMNQLCTYLRNQVLRLVAS